MNPPAAGADLDAFVAELCDELGGWHVPGLQLAVVSEGTVLFSGGVGSCGVDDPSPLTGTTLFHHGSCAKAYTSLLAAVLEEDGLLNLDEPVRRYVPELDLPDPVLSQRVTTRDLLSHRSGLARHDLAWILNPSWSRDELVRRLRHLPLAQDFRTTMEYSNFGYALAGLAIGRAAGSTWEDQLRQRVLDPAGMHRTFTSMAKVFADPQRAQPHLIRGDGAKATDYRVLDGMAPAGQLMTSADDAARWLLLQLGGGTNDGDPVVSGDAVATTHQLAIGMPADLSPFPQLLVLGYALGWVIGTFRHRPALWHSGGIDGFLTQTLLLPEERIGVTASANLHMSDLPLAVALQTVDRILHEGDGGSWYDAARTSATELPSESPPPGGTQNGGPVPWPCHPKESFTGTYTDNGYGELAVTVMDGDLRVRAGAYDLDTRHRHFDTWDLRYDQLDVDVALTFVTNSDGTVDEAVAELDPQTDPIRFRRLPSTRPS